MSIELMLPCKSNLFSLNVQDSLAAIVKGAVHQKK